MGIPKLMKDLLPYTERAILGQPLKLEVAVSISAVVIDGPALVYEVYRRQMRSTPEINVPLACRHIGKAVVDFLDEIQDHGVEIKTIYFDGALPVSKRETRLERLEKHRHELNQFLKAQDRKGLAKDSPTQPAKDKALLAILPSTPLRSLKALEPPFMVASAIEHLKQSVYRPLIDVIPDEAEVGCIMCASQHQNVAVLSNDSDLVAFPSASAEGLTLILLDTLEQVDDAIGQPFLLADCLRPAQISCRMSISSLHLLAYQRYVDPSASASVIKRRAQLSPVIDSSLSTSREFMAGYPLNLVSEVERALPAQHCHLLDPRLSELLSEYWHSRHAINKETAMHMYLPTLFEDVTKESPWAHGSVLRQLAYSLLNLSVPSHLRRASLLEYQRKGYQISGVEVDLLHKTKLSGILDKETHVLQHIHSETSATEVMTSWQKVALQAVNERRRDDGRVVFLPAMHLRACIQAVLYSLRLLKQAAEFFGVTAPKRQVMPQDVLEKLATMPSLADLIDATQELYVTK